MSRVKYPSGGMRMALRKIELMYREFGKCPGNKCKTCSNFVHGRYRSRVLSKCDIYGCTHSEASDWSGRYEACGMFNKEWSGNNIIHLVSGTPKVRSEIDGQESMFGGENNEK